MAKKKARKTTKKKKPALTDQDVYRIFGVGTGSQALRQFISGQRRINGRFYHAIDAIFDELKGKSKGKNPKLDAAAKENEGVPGDSPGCS